MANPAGASVYAFGMHSMRLPHGDVGRIVNSFISHKHPDAVEWQRRYRQSLWDTLPRNAALMDAVRAPVYLVMFHMDVNTVFYQHAYRLPDYQQIIGNIGFRVPRAEDPSGDPEGCRDWFPIRRLSRLIECVVPMMVRLQQEMPSVGWLTRAPSMAT
jgi:hypothetical protein